jgi:hypothetical protein
MSTGRGNRNARRETIQEQTEQMLARGRSLGYILARLPVTTADVDAAMCRMDAAVADDPFVVGALA